MRHRSAARTRGGSRPRSFSRSISQSGCGWDPTRLVSIDGTLASAVVTKIGPVGRRTYHWSENSILDQSPEASYILSRRLGGSPPHSVTGTYLSSPVVL